MAGDQTIVISIDDFTGEESTSDSIELSFTEAAKVSDLVSHLGFMSNKVSIEVRGQRQSPDCSLGELDLLHGDTIRLIRGAALSDSGQRLAQPEAHALCLVQVDGIERGRRIPIFEGGQIVVIVYKSAEHYLTKLDAEDSPVKSDEIGRLSVEPSAFNSIEVQPSGNVIIDGRPGSDRREVLAGSAIRFVAAPNEGSAAGGVEFRVVERLADSPVESGWVDYRVVSTGSEQPLELDTSVIQVGSKPSKPPERDLLDLFFSYVPMLFMSGFLAISTGRYWFLAIYVVVYAMRAWNDRRRQKVALTEFEMAMTLWKEQFDEAQVEFRSFVSAEHTRRVERYCHAFGSANVWLAKNRMSTLWQRNPNRPGFLEVWVGTGRYVSPEIFAVPSGIDGQEFAETKVDLDDLRVVDKAPITTSLAANHLAVVGDREDVTQALSNIIADLSVNHSPLHVVFAALLPAGGEEFDSLAKWMRWLPHIRRTTSCLGGSRIVRGSDKSSNWIRQFRKRMSDGVTLRENVILVIHEGVDVEIGELEECLELANGRLHIIWLSSNEQTIPSLVGERLMLRGAGFDGTKLIGYLDSHVEGTLQMASTGAQIGAEDDQPQLAVERLHHQLEVRFVQSTDQLETLARALSPLTDERQGVKSAAIPSSVSLDRFLGLPGFKEPHEKIDQLRNKANSSDRLQLELGMLASDVLEVDLVKFGPHMLVGGTTGSGKSEFLQALVASAVTRYSEAELNLALVDFKGGASFDTFRDLPHVVAEASNLDPRRLDRVIAFLSGELDYRMSVLRDHKCKDYETLRLAGVHLPRLLVVLDEFAAAVSSNAEVKVLADTIAARGRSLGIHVIFATQNPAGATTSDMDTNIGARVCLRMLSDSDAKSVVGDAAPAAIPVDLPGRAFLKKADGSLVEFQTPFATGKVEPDQEKLTTRVFI